MALDWYLIAREQGFETPKQMFEKMYIELDYSIQEIAEILTCSTWSIRYAFSRFDIVIKKHGGRRTGGRASASTIARVINRLEEAKK